MFFGRNDAKAVTPVLWPLHAKSWHIGKDSDAGRDWGQEKGTTEDEMAGWHHWLDGRESEWTPGLVIDREAGHAAIHRVAESDMTEWVNWTCNMEGRDALWGQIWVWETPQQFLLVCCLFSSWLDSKPRTHPGEKDAAPNYSSSAGFPVHWTHRDTSRHAQLNLQWFHTGSFYLRWRHLKQLFFTPNPATRQKGNLVVFSGL